MKNLKAESSLNNVNTNKMNGFSFIEILVVVTIIGIIASIGMVTYTEFLKQSRDAKRKGDIEQIRAALEMYKSTNNSYPASITFGGDICDDPPACASGVYYLRKVPNDPKPDLYTYFYSSAGGADYTIAAFLEQGSSSSCFDCDIISTAACNYCMGPYGQL